VKGTMKGMKAKTLYILFKIIFIITIIFHDHGQGEGGWNAGPYIYILT